MKIDLHVHSKRSDGADSPEDLFKKAQALGIPRFALTDHDILDNMDHIIKMARGFNIDLIPGVEISAFDEERNRKVHIIGLNIDYENEALNDMLLNIRQERQYVAKQMVARIKSLGYPIEWHEVESLVGKNGCVFKTHIMQSLVNHGVCEDLHGSLHKKLFSRGGIAHIPIDYPKAEKAVRAVKKANGMAVIAHPALYGNKELIPSLLQAGLEGIEVYHPSHTQQDVEILLSMAEQYNLFISGGSDYHGSYGNRHIQIGDYGIDENAYNSILELKGLHKIEQATEK